MWYAVFIPELKSVRQLVNQPVSQSVYISDLQYIYKEVNSVFVLFCFQDLEFLIKGFGPSSRTART